jgi:DNA-binding Lrp family transcriptional regulator
MTVSSPPAHHPHPVRPTPEETAAAASLDQRIAAAMQLGGRITWRDIGALLGVSESTVARRARAMMATGVVRTTALAEPLRCGLGHPVLIQLTCAPDRRAAVAAELAARPDVRLVVLVTGRADIAAELIVGSRDELARVLVDEIGMIPGVTQTTTETVLRTMKMAFDWSRPLLAPFPVPPRPPVDVRSAAPPVALDATDMALIEQLRQDGRRSYQDLATELGISESAARRRLDSLVSSGAATLVTIVDPPFLGYQVEVFLYLRVELARLEDVADALVARDEVRYLSATSGHSDLVAEVILPTQEDLYRFRTHVLGELPGIREVEMTSELRTVKRAFLTMPAR